MYGSALGVELQLYRELRQSPAPPPRWRQGQLVVRELKGMTGLRGAEEFLWPRN